MSIFCTVVPGDLTTAYRKGYHRVVSVQRRFRNPDLPSYDSKYYAYDVCPPGYKEMGALVTYVTVLDSVFNPVKSKKEYVCDSSYCKKIEVGEIMAERDAKIKALTEGYDRVIALCTT